MASGAGILIGGRFWLASTPLGQGSFGRVWLGHDQLLDRDVAIKEVLLPDNLAEAERAALVARTIREARSAARLKHSSVVTIHDVIEHDGAPWIVMEYVQGISLAESLKDDGAMPWQRVAQLGAKLADALAHAHGHGIVHRDLKPANILLTGERPVLTDFGIARIVDATVLTSSNMVLGTPVYMAPEQIDGRQASPAADIWSLGVTLYEMVEGTRPFRGPNLHALYAAILTRDPAPAVRAGPLGQVLAQMLAKDPTRRPAAAAIAEMLSTALRQQGPLTPRPVTERVGSANPWESSGTRQRSIEGPEPSTMTVGHRVAPIVGPLYATPRRAAPLPGTRPQTPQALSPSGKVVAIVGLLASLAADIPAMAENKNSEFLYVAAALAALAGLATVFSRTAWRLPASFVLGLWVVSIPSLVSEILFARTAHASGGDLSLRMTSEAAGVVAVIVLLLALSRSCGQGSWLHPLGLSITVFCGAVLSEGAFLAWILNTFLSQVAWVSDPYIYNNMVAPNSNWNGYRHAIWIFSAIALTMTLISAVYALRLQDRTAGSALLLGLSLTIAPGITGHIKYVIPVGYYAARYIPFPPDTYFSSSNGFARAGEVLFLVLGVILTIVYANHHGEH